MLRGLEGRRIAVTTLESNRTDAVAVIEDALMQAGAEIEVLTTRTEDDTWHGGKYAGLIVIGGVESTLPISDPGLVQLVREFLVSEKPIAAQGTGVGVIVEAGGAAGRTLTAQGTLKAAVETAGGKMVDAPVHADGFLITSRGGTDIPAFARAVVRDFSQRLGDEGVDEMSAQSFPASDPPATNPGVGAASDTDART